jgi:hypothetical protein
MVKVLDNFFNSFLVLPLGKSKYYTMPKMPEIMDVRQLAPSKRVYGPPDWHTKGLNRCYGSGAMPMPDIIASITAAAITEPI